MQASRGCCPGLTAAAGLRAGAAESAALATAGGCALSRARREVLSCLPRKGPKEGHPELAREPCSGRLAPAAPNSRSCASLRHPAPCFRREAPSARGSQREGGKPEAFRPLVPRSRPASLRGARIVCFLVPDAKATRCTNGFKLCTGPSQSSFPTILAKESRVGRTRPHPEALIVEGPTRAPSRCRVCNSGCGRRALSPIRRDRSPTDPLLGRGRSQAPFCPPGGKGTDGGPAAPFAAPSAEVGRGIIRRCLSERSAASRVQRRPRPASERGDPGPRQRTGMRQSG